MSENNVHVVTDLPAPKKPFFLNKTFIKTVLAATAVTGLVVAYKKGLLEDTSVGDLDVIEI